jgi:hypothetical protein
LGSTRVSKRTKTHGSVATRSFPVLSASSIQKHSTSSSRLDATDHARKRLPTATENATALCPADRDLATIVDAWPALPDAIRAGILAMVKAASVK